MKNSPCICKGDRSVGHVGEKIRFNSSQVSDRLFSRMNHSPSWSQGDRPSSNAGAIVTNDLYQVLIDRLMVLYDSYQVPIDRLIALYDSYQVPIDR